jgi:hypothetical protein
VEGYHTRLVARGAEANANLYQLLDVLHAEAGVIIIIKLGNGVFNDKSQEKGKAHLSSFLAIRAQHSKFNKNHNHNHNLNVFRFRESSRSETGKEYRL